MESEFPMRINKYLAHKGHATRRGSDELISSGKVYVNGEVAVLGQKVLEKDVVDIKNVPKRKYRYFLYNKPRGVITHSPAPHETDIVTQIKNDHGITEVFPIGRLDKDSEGLILITDDGRVTERLLNPEREHEREYEVTVDKKITGNFLKKLENGVNIEGYQTKTTKTTKTTDRNFRIILTEGKKHQIRRMCAALGYQIKTLKRTRILNLSTNSLKRGDLKELTKTERDRFIRAIGL